MSGLELLTLIADSGDAHATVVTLLVGSSAHRCRRALLVAARRADEPAVARRVAADNAAARAL